MALFSAWSEDSEEFLAALVGFQEAHGLSDDFAIWICTFALVTSICDHNVLTTFPWQYQASDGAGPSVSRQLELDPFTKVIMRPTVKSGRGLIAIHTTAAELYDRLWWYLLTRCICHADLTSIVAVPLK